MESQKHTPVYLTANYHTHTVRCGHAVGADEEYVKAAIAAGMQVLGFSDHSPWPDQVPPRDTLHMRMNRAAEYAASVCALREKYRDQIAIYLGFEAEYLPEFYEAQMKMCEELDVDYLIMGQHFLPESLIYAGSRTGSRRVLEQYVDTVLEGLSTGAYSCLCHPDLVDFAGDGAFYRKQMRRLCEGVKKMGIPLEINLLGLGEGRHYPNERFWTIAGETGNRAIIGVDAHDPASIGKHRIFEAALALAERCGLEVEERMEFSATAPWRQRL